MKFNPSNRLLRAPEKETPSGGANWLGPAAQEVPTTPPKGEEEPPAKTKEELEEEERKRKEKEKQTPPDPNKPNFSREKKEGEPPKQKPDKEESIATLRTERDNFRSENTKLVEEIKPLKEAFGIENLSVLTPLVEFLKEGLDGVITADKVSSKINELKGLGQKMGEYENQLGTYKAKIRDYDIANDPDFVSQFVTPIENAKETLSLEFANFAMDGDKRKTIGPNATNKFMAALMNPKLSGADVKVLLAQFQKEYKEETSEDPIVSGVTPIMNAYRKIHELNEKAQNAYKNWEAEKSESKRRTTLDQEAKTKAENERNKRERSRLAEKAYHSFNFDSLEGIIPEDEIKAAFDEEFNFGEKLFTGDPAVTPPYNDLITRGVKSVLYDKLMEEVTRLREDNKILKQKTKTEIPGSGGGGATRQNTNGEKISFLGAAQKELDTAR